MLVLFDVCKASLYFLSRTFFPRGNFCVGTLIKNGMHKSCYAIDCRVYECYEALRSSTMQVIGIQRVSRDYIYNSNTIETRILYAVFSSSFLCAVIPIKSFSEQFHESSHLYSLKIFSTANNRIFLASNCTVKVIAPENANIVAVRMTPNSVIGETRIGSHTFSLEITDEPMNTTCYRFIMLLMKSILLRNDCVIITAILFI